MIYRLHLLLVAPFLLLGACSRPIVEDGGDVCVYARVVDGQNHLHADAEGFYCSSDHKGAYLECTITVDGLSAHVETTFKDGKDPDDACAAELMTSCEIVVEPGDYTVDFAGEERMITVPGGEYVCFGSDPNIDPSTGSESG